jgi:hypothetical protein
MYGQLSWPSLFAGSTLVDSTNLGWKSKPRSGSGMVVHIGNPSYLGGRGRRTAARGQLGKTVRPYLKNKLKAKRTEGGGRRWFIPANIYSGGRDQEDHSSKPSSSRDPILKAHHKKGLVEWIKV